MNMKNFFKKIKQMFAFYKKVWYDIGEQLFATTIYREVIP